MESSYYPRNKEKVKEFNANYRSLNKDEINDYQRKKWSEMKNEVLNSNGKINLCNYCKKIKDINEFVANKRICLRCNENNIKIVNHYSKKYYDKNREQILEKKKELYKTDKERLLSYRNIERYRKYQKEYHRRRRERTNYLNSNLNE